MYRTHRARLIPPTLSLLAVLLAAGTAGASHITGYDLSHRISSTGTASFIYKVYHRNCLKYPGSACPGTGGMTLDFGDGSNQTRDAESISGCPPRCPSVPSQITYRDCTDLDDPATCDTAITTRYYGHIYTECGPFEATQTTAARVDGSVNMPTGAIVAKNVVAPCCRTATGDFNQPPSFSSLPVFLAFQDARYYYPLGAYDRDGDPISLEFLSVPSTGFYECRGSGHPAPCDTRVPIGGTLEWRAFDACRLPGPDTKMDIAGDHLDWDLPESGAGCDQTRRGYYYVGARITDEVCGGTAEREFQLELLAPAPVTTPPVLSVGPEYDACVDEDTVTIDLSAADADLGDVVTLFVTPPTFPGMAFAQTPGNPATGRFTFTPTSTGSGVGTFGFTFIAQDDATPVRTDEHSFTIRVEDCSCPASASATSMTACSSDAVTLDGSGSDVPGCSVPLEYRFRHGTDLLRDWAPDPTYLWTTPIDGVYEVAVRCPDDVTCLATSFGIVDLVPDVVPGPIGNSLRLIRADDSDVALSWPFVVDSYGYSVYRALVKGDWSDPALATDIAGTTLRLPDALPAPSSLADLFFYQVVGASCSGREGPF